MKTNVPHILTFKKKSNILDRLGLCSLQDGKCRGRQRSQNRNFKQHLFHMISTRIQMNFLAFFFFFIKETNAYDTDSKRCRRKHNKMGNLLIRLLQGNQLMLTSFWCPSWYFIHKKIYILLYSIYTNCSKLYTCAACSFFFFLQWGSNPGAHACKHADIPRLTLFIYLTISRAQSITLQIEPSHSSDICVILFCIWIYNHLFNWPHNIWILSNLLPFETMLQ